MFFGSIFCFFVVYLCLVWVSFLEWGNVIFVSKIIDRRDSISRFYFVIGMIEFFDLII